MIIEGGAQWIQERCGCLGTQTNLLLMNADCRASGVGWCDVKVRLCSSENGFTFVLSHPETLTQT